MKIVPHPDRDKIAHRLHHAETSLHALDTLAGLLDAYEVPDGRSGDPESTETATLGALLGGHLVAVRHTLDREVAQLRLIFGSLPSTAILTVEEARHFGIDLEDRTEETKP